MRLLALVLAPALVVACAPPDRDAKKRVEVDTARWTALVERTAELVDADRGDCARMASDVHALLGANAALIKAANAALGDGFKLPDDARAHVTAAIGRMMPGIDACGAEAEVQQAFKVAKPDEG
jgi:hypothetical protein